VSGALYAMAPSLSPANGGRSVACGRAATATADGTPRWPERKGISTRLRATPRAGTAVGPRERDSRCPPGRERHVDGAPEGKRDTRVAGRIERHIIQVGFRCIQARGSQPPRQRPIRGFENREWAVEQPTMDGFRPSRVSDRIEWCVSQVGRGGARRTGPGGGRAPSSEVATSVRRGQRGRSPCRP
jgi:hypothetical protein